MPTKTIKVPRELHRQATIERGQDGKPALMSISSDTPYKRYEWDWEEGEWREYWEVLDHSPSGIDDERLKAGLPILFNHNRSAHLARARDYANDGHRLTLDMTKFLWASGPFAQEKRADIESGALPDTSVGYELTSDGSKIGEKDGAPIYRFKWRLYEASSVTIPADASVGVGRQRSKPEETDLREISIVDENNLANRDNLAHTGTTPTPKGQSMKVTPAVRQFLNADNGGGSGNGGEAPEVIAEKARKEGVAEYIAHCKKIDDWVTALKNDAWRAKAAVIAIKHKNDGAEFDAFRTEALNICTTEGSLDTPTREDGNRFQVIGEREQDPRRRQSIGAQLINSKEFKAAMASGARNISVGMEIDTPILGIRGKVAMAQRAGWTSADLAAVNVQIQSGTIGLGIQRLTIMDLIAPGTTGAAAIIYPRENSFGTVDGVAPAAGSGGVPGMPRAKSVGERGLKPLWEPDLTTETATVKQIAITTKVPNQFMADFPAFQSYIDERMPFMVDTETEAQILYGDGLGNNLKGIFSTTGIQTRPITLTDDSTKAASLKQGLTDIQVQGFFEPTGFAMHPYDWETASLLKDTSGRFLAGGPFYIPYTNGVFMEMNTFWGKPVVVSAAVTYGKPVAGAWKLGAQYFIREGMRLETTNSNEDDFRRNMIAIRAEHRLALAVYRPLAFIEFQGFPARA